jgi:phosphoglycolate phosphatase-like HAD superfamily hydrolase
MYSGYIFDLEGTLLDSVPQNLRSLQDALEQARFDVAYASLQIILRPGRRPCRLSTCAFAGWLPEKVRPTRYNIPDGE